MQRALLVAALLLTACHKPEPPAQRASDSIDYNLRTFLGISTLNPKFTLPDSAKAFYPVAVFFVDGKEVARKNGPAMLSFGDTEQRPVSVDFQLLWQVEGKLFRRALVVMGGNTMDLSNAFPYWQQMLSGSFSSWNVPMEGGAPYQYQGVTILGIVASGMDAGTIAQGHLNPASAGKYVVALGVCYGSDRDALEKQFHAVNP